MELQCRYAMGGIARPIPCYEVYSSSSNDEKDDIRQELKKRGFPTDLHPRMKSRGVLVPKEMKEALRVCNVKGIDAVHF